MAKKRGAANIALSELSDAIDEAIGEIAEELYEEVDRGLDKAARHMERALQQASSLTESAFLSMNTVLLGRIFRWGCSFVGNQDSPKSHRIVRS